MTITELAVLGMLGYVGRPISGYDLHKLIGISVGFIWQPSKTQLYAVLPRLLDAGLARRREVEQRQRPDKNLYRITSRGRLTIREWVDREEDMRDEDRGRRVLLLKVFFGRQGDREALVRQVAAFRDASALKLATYQRMWEEGKTPPRDDLYARLTLRHGIMRTRGAVEWADAALQELTQ